MIRPGSRKVRVLVVDDSASVRETLREIIDGDPNLEVMAINSPSQTTVSPTKAIALMFAIPRRIGPSNFNLKTSVSPGTTFLRNLILSIVMKYVEYSPSGG